MPQSALPFFPRSSIKRRSRAQISMLVYRTTNLENCCMLWLAILFYTFVFVCHKVTKELTRKYLSKNAKLLNAVSSKKNTTSYDKKKLRFVPTETISKPFLGTYACTHLWRTGGGGGGTPNATRTHGRKCQEWEELYNTFKMQNLTSNPHTVQAPTTLYVQNFTLLFGLPFCAWRLGKFW